MPLNLKDYEMKTLLTKEDVFDLIFLETHEELMKLGFISPDEAWEKNLPHRLELDALAEQWSSWFLRRCHSGHFEIINGMVRREEVFCWLFSEKLLEYYEKTERFIISKEVYDLVERFAKQKLSQSPAEQKYSESEPKPASNKNNLTFYQVNKTWRVGFEEIQNVPNTKGMRYLQTFFLNPNKYYSGLETYDSSKVDANSIISADIFERDGKASFRQTEEDINSVEAGGELLSLKEDLLEMKRDYEEAKEQRRPDAELLEKEYMEALKFHQSLNDKRGNPRDTSSMEAKAIKAVAKNIKTAKKNILEHLPELSDLLDDIKTGNSYGYIPSSPDNSITIITKKTK
jgi:hypothetical protein